MTSGTRRFARQLALDRDSRGHYELPSSRASTSTYQSAAELPFSPLEHQSPGHSTNFHQLHLAILDTLAKTVKGFIDPFARAVFPVSAAPSQVDITTFLATMFSRSIIARRAFVSAPTRSFQTSRILAAGKESALRMFIPGLLASIPYHPFVPRQRDSRLGVVKQEHSFNRLRRGLTGCRQRGTRRRSREDQERTDPEAEGRQG